MTRAELMARMSAPEFQRWKYYDQQLMLPDRRHEFALGMIWSMLINRWKRSDISKVFTAVDLIDTLDGVERKPQQPSPERQIAFFKMLAMATGGTVNTDPPPEQPAEIQEEQPHGDHSQPGRGPDGAD